MKKIYKICLIITLICQYLLADPKPPEVEYIHPIPDSKYHSPYTTIIIRCTSTNYNFVNNDIIFTVTGQKSGEHHGIKILSSDGRTIIYQPEKSFYEGEAVQVEIASSLLLKKFIYTFTVSENFLSTNLIAEQEDEPLEQTKSTSAAGEIRLINGVSVPSDFPALKPTVKRETEQGLLFLTAWNWFLIFKNDGTPYFYRKSNSHVWDFRVQPDGTLTYMEGATGKRLDNKFEVVETYKCKHGYKTDPHEFVYCKNGHVLLVAEDAQMMNIQDVFPNARERTQVVGTHIQELDSEQNVIFEWRCWDHYQLTDALHENWTRGTVHSAHLNAIDIDYDGHILVSSRLLDEITKIDRQTGNIIWRLGGVNNQFVFTNESELFTYQHDIRAVPGNPNHYTLFDNGNFHTLTYSRAVEYKLDVNNRIAEKVWEYRNSPDRYSNWMGSVQRLPNGNTLITWAHKSLPKVTEVTSDGRIVYEADYEIRETSYRGHRHNWSGNAGKPFLIAENYPDKITLLFNQFGATEIAKYYIYADTTENPVTRIDSTTNTYAFLSNLQNKTGYFFRVTSVDSHGVESDFSNQVYAFTNFVLPGQNLVLNGDFSQFTQNWYFDRRPNDIAESEVDSLGQYHVNVFYESIDPSDASLFQKYIVLIEGKSYRLEFDAYANNDRIIEARLVDSPSWIDYSELGLIQISKEKKRYEMEFTMIDPTDYMAKLVFNFAYETGDVFLDNIVLTELPSLAVNESKTSTNTTFHLNQNYPNPFNDHTIIRYFLPSMSDVEITIFDIRGREIEKVHSAKQIGEQFFLFDGCNKSTGIYFCQIRAFVEHGSIYSDSIKLTLLK